MFSSRGQRRHQVERLEDEADPVAAQRGQRLVAQPGDLDAVDARRCPRSGCPAPARQCISVDLPEPDGPMIAVSRPRPKSTAHAVQRVHLGLATAVDLRQAAGAGDGGVRRPATSVPVPCCPSSTSSAGDGSVVTRSTAAFPPATHRAPSTDPRAPAGREGVSPWSALRGDPAPTRAQSVSGPSARPRRGSRAPAASARAAAGACRPTPGRRPGGRTSRTAVPCSAASRRSRQPARSPPTAPGPCVRSRAGRPRRARSAGLAVAEVDELEQPGNDPAHPPEHQRVEPHLEQRLAPRTPPKANARSCSRPPAARPRGRRPAGRRSRAASARRPGPSRRRARVRPAPAGSGPPGVNHRSISSSAELSQAAGDRPRRPGTGSPAPGSLAAAPATAGAAARWRLDGAVHGRQVEEPLEDRVHDRAADGCGRRRLGEPVDHSEAVEQRAVHEVGGPAR